LVSHWAVESQSAMQLTTRMFEESAKGTTKAEALRRSMMHLADQPLTAHPAFWAPFVVVGEGAR
jgi:CHAT domain-containing protein